MSRILTLGATVFITAIIFSACKKPAGQQTTADLQKEANQVAAAIQAGQPVRCTIDRVATEAQPASHMEYFIKGNKIKMTGVEIEANQPEQGFMISDGEFIYVWDDQTKEGFKFPVVDPAEAQAAADQAAQNAPEVPDFSQEDVQKQYEDQGYTLDCDQTNISDEEFVPPTDVAFQDFSAMMKNIPTGGQAAGGTQGLTAEQKAAMEEILKQAQQ